MIVSINQLAYLPWLGYFERIKNSDVFVFFDTVQFEKNSFTNRNKIKTPNGSKWLTIPIKTSGLFKTNTLKNCKILDAKWQKSHWLQIKENYRKSSFWQEYSPQFEVFYQKPYNKLSDLCWEMLQTFVKIFNIKTKLIRSSSLPEFITTKDDLVLDILKHLRADEYISGALGRNYIHEDKFLISNIKLRYQDYKPKNYTQLFGEFIPYLGAIDLIFNQGPESMKYI